MPTIAACPLKVITTPPYSSLSQWEGPYGPPPTRSRKRGHWSMAKRSSDTALSPVVHRDSLLVIAAHDAPVAVRLTAHYEDVDGLRTKHRDQFIRCRLELRGPRLLTKGCPWVEIVLDQLIVPVLPGWHTGVVVDPRDELLLGVEPAAVDALPRRDRVEQERWREVRIHAAQHIAHVRVPVALAQPQR